MTRILITGAGGMVGRALLPELAGLDVTATDLAPPPDLPGGVAFVSMDVTGPDPARIIARLRPEVIVHLASVVTPPAGGGRAFAYRVDVTGTANVLAAALKAGVRRLVVTSSGAAYGYQIGRAHV